MQLNKTVIKAIQVVSILVLMVSGCAQKTIKPDMFSSGDAHSANISPEVSADTISYNANQAVELALAYCRQGAYEKGASLFDQAAEFAKQVALNLKDLEKELRLTDEVSEEHGLTLYDLIDQVEKSDGKLENKQVEMVISTAKPILSNARSLFVSLRDYRAAIKDPELIEKLKQAAQTAETLQQYIASLEHQGTSNASSKGVLIRKLKGLLEQFNGIHAQTGILMARLGNDKDRLKLINQIATSGLIIDAISGGDAMVGTIGQEYLGDIKANMSNIDNDIDILNQHVGGSVTNAGFVGLSFPDWPEYNFKP